MSMRDLLNTDSCPALAEAYAAVARGWAVFPIKRGTKQPHVAGGFYAASRDTDQVAAWAAKWPGCNWAVATGTTSGNVVVDFDNKPGALTPSDVAGRFGPLPRTLTSRTGGGGCQMIFRTSEHLSSGPDRFGPDTFVDIKANGGYVVLPGSIHPSGRRYEWEVLAEVADAPEWLIQHCPKETDEARRQREEKQRYNASVGKIESAVPTPAAKRLRKLLGNFISVRHWGLYDPNGDGVHVNDGQRYPNNLTAKAIQTHLNGEVNVGFTSGSDQKYGKGLAVISVDRVGDGLSLVSLLQEQHFAGAYVEENATGWRLFVKLDFGWSKHPDKLISRTRVNKWFMLLEDGLRAIGQHHRWTTTINVRGQCAVAERVDEATGEVTVEKHLPALAALPWPTTQHDSERLIAWLSDGSSLFLVDLVRCVNPVARLSTVDVDEREEKQRYNASVGKTPRGVDKDASAFVRMRSFAFQLARRDGRAPSADQLNAEYKQAYGRTNDTRERRRRAEDCAEFCRKTFKPTYPSGFSTKRARLQKIVSELVTDRHIDPKVREKVRVGNLDEDLAVTLAYVEDASFTVAADPLYQCGLPQKRLAAGFKKLYDDGEISAEKCDRHQAGFLLRMLRKNGLADCICPRYRFGGEDGVGQKWVIGKRHPDYGKFLAFFETVKIKYVGMATAGAELQQVAT